MKQFNRFLLALFISLTLVVGPSTVNAETTMSSIRHIFIIMQENRSFDHYFGTYTNVNGLPPGIKLPLNGTAKFASPFHLTSQVMQADPPHSWEAFHLAWSNGTNTGFANAMGTESLGYYDYHEIPYYWAYASEFVLADNYYSSQMGPTVPNRIFALSGQSGGYYDNPTQYGFKLKVNSIFHVLEERGISWGDYWEGIREGKQLGALMFDGIKNNTATGSIIAHPDRFIADLKVGEARTVSWINAVSPHDEHPPWNATDGQLWVVNIVNEIMKSQYWNSSAIFITWDEAGGLYDHVPPPQVDSWGYGFRVPLLVVSPYAKQGYVSHVQYDHTSLLKFIEWNFGLPCMTDRNCQANNLLDAFDFSQKPRPPLVLPGIYEPNIWPLRINGEQQTFAPSAQQKIETVENELAKIRADLDTLQVRQSEMQTQLAAKFDQGTTANQINIALGSIVGILSGALATVLILKRRNKWN